MTDRLTIEQRSNLMRRVRGKDTAPELLVRRLAHAAGFRFRLHRKDLPGNPDLCFPTRHKVIFVHGCFWHGHGCKIGRLPKSRLEFWQPKIARNRERDTAAVAALATLGWRVFTVWQCQTKDRPALRQRIVEFLSAS
ncbi:MAG TPA: DNA mismatch endonuclease Vsr [Methylocella sp.]